MSAINALEAVSKEITNEIKLHDYLAERDMNHKWVGFGLRIARAILAGKIGLEARG